MTTPPDTSRPVVVKLGGSTLGAHDTSLRDIADAHRTGRAIVVVHGGGAAVSEWLARSGIEARFVQGLRVTDASTLEIVVAVLAGVVNKQLVAQLTALGAVAVGLSGADASILRARRYDPDLSYVGRIEEVDAHPLHEQLRAGRLPVVAPIAIEVDAGTAQLLNTNADTAAGEIAAALGASQLVFLTDVAGVLDADRRLLSKLSVNDIQPLIESGVAAGGMIPKLEAAVRAASAGCATRIVGGTKPGALAAVLAGEPGGTEIEA